MGIVGAPARYDGAMLSTVAPFLVAQTHVELPVPPFVYGLIALAAFAMMLGVLFAFRQAATKIASPENTVAHDDGHGDDGHRTGDHH